MMLKIVVAPAVTFTVAADVYVPGEGMGGSRDPPVRSQRAYQGAA